MSADAILRRALAVSLLALAIPAGAQDGFVHYETVHTHPLDLAPGAQRLLAVNTADGRLMVFDATGAQPVLERVIAVGYDPVSVRARTASEAWVVNHISDSVSVVDVVTGRTLATLPTDDEPADVIFAGAPQRAFVTCSEANTVLVFDPANLALAPTRLEIVGEDPRALALSPDGTQVWAAIFESSNRTTILGGGHPGQSYPPQMVNNPLGPWGGANPPPNAGAGFDPPIAPGLPTALKVSLIIRQDDAGQWLDDNGGDWTDFVSGPSAALSGRLPGWEIVDHDVAVIDVATLQVTYVKRLMNLCMALAANPATGHAVVVGSDAINEVRYVQNLRGRFVKYYAASADPGMGRATRTDLNPHLDYVTVTLPLAARDESLSDPRAIVFHADGQQGWVVGMGSSNVIAVNADGSRNTAIPAIPVGAGPTGAALDEGAQRLYVLNKFAASISVIDTASASETARVPYFDPTPDVIRDGREYLYDSHLGSGTGHLSCASCHPDARMDRLAWDLGDPLGAMKDVSPNNLKANLPSLSNAEFRDYHPMKGPMLTQTLQDIIGKEPLHWRGDMFRFEDFHEVNVALAGDDEPFDDEDMQEFESYLATIHYPPNPFRNLDNTLPTALDMKGHYTTGRFSPPGQPFPPGDAVNGLLLFSPPNFLAGNNACITCHANSIGAGTDMKWNASLQMLEPIPPGPDGEHHLMLVASDGFTNKSMKVPQLRNNYERLGFNTTQLQNTAGFGTEHDGSADSTERHIAQPPFNVVSDQDVADILAFIMCLSGNELPLGLPTDINAPPGLEGKDSHAAVGRQVTLTGAAPTQAQLDTLALFDGMAAAGRIGLAARGVLDGEARGFSQYGADRFDSDRLGQSWTLQDLLDQVDPGEDLTFMAVPEGTQRRIGIDRDADGWLDGDELDLGSDPADPGSVPLDWISLGAALAGSDGEPQLLGKGPLVSSGTVTFVLAHARPLAPVYVVAGLSAINVPFKGGFLVPSPDVLVFGLFTDGFGALELPAALPPGLPPGLTLLLQEWIADPLGPQGYAASPAISATAP
jgi:YVTN family beta-propeller protein